jgi:hypothetical protein
MIDPIPTPIQYPIFYPCSSAVEFEDLDTQACELLGYPDAGATDYCNPIIDINGIYFFTVNPEVLSLFTTAQLDTCVPYDDIVLPSNPPMK